MYWYQVNSSSFVHISGIKHCGNHVPDSIGYRLRNSAYCSANVHAVIRGRVHVTYCEVLGIRFASGGRRGTVFPRARLGSVVSTSGRRPCSVAVLRVSPLLNYSQSFTTYPASISQWPLPASSSSSFFRPSVVVLTSSA